jgi:glycerophosphoryl diester phosphodiesterase
MSVTLVAHRGDCQNQLENSLASIQAALDNGTNNIEIDIQFSQDGIGLLFHDRTVQHYYANSSSIQTQQAIGELSYAQLSEHPFCLLHQSRLSGATCYITRLAEVVALLAQYPQARLFVEIKRVNFQYFSYQFIYRKIITLLATIKAQCILISFSYRFLRYCRRQSAFDLAIGYVLPSWPAHSAKMLARLAPEFIFCDHSILPPEFNAALHTSIWVLYDVDSIELAQQLMQQEIYWFETFEPAQRRTELLAHKINCQ